MSQIEPPRPARGATSAERGPHTSDLERELASDQPRSRKVVAAASPRLYFGIANEYPTGIKQFLWLAMGILYPFWVVGVLIAWPVMVVLHHVGIVLFEVWWFLTGWFWRRLGGEKPTRDTWKHKDAERRARIEEIRAERDE